MYLQTCTDMNSILLFAFIREFARVFCKQCNISNVHNLFQFGKDYLSPSEYLGVCQSVYIGTAYCVTLQPEVYQYILCQNKVMCDSTSWCVTVQAGVWQYKLVCAV